MGTGFQIEAKTKRSQLEPDVLSYNAVRLLEMRISNQRVESDGGIGKQSIYNQLNTWRCVFAISACEMAADRPRIARRNVALPAGV